MRPAVSENTVQRAVIDFLQVMVPGAYVFAIPNAARRRRDGKAGNAVPGLRRGMPDLGFLCDEYPGLTHFLEVKRPGETATEVQLACHRELRQRGAHVDVAESIDDVRLALKAWGIETREAKEVR